MTSRPYRAGDFGLIMDLVSELWPKGRHAIGYAFMSQRLPYDNWRMQLWFDGDTFVGWAWQRGWVTPPGLSFELRPGYEERFGEMLEWSEPGQVAVAQDDPVLATLAEHGFAQDPEGTSILWLSQPLVEVDAPVLPDGFTLATMADGVSFESRAAAHRSAFQGNRFTDDVFATVRSEAPWRADLDCVVLDPDGEVAAFAIAWLDERNAVGELEPLGVRADVQRLGLGRAIGLHALGRLHDAGAQTALIGSTDGGHAQELYRSLGFRDHRRTVTYRRTFQLAVSTDGARVYETDVFDARTLERARAAGAQLVWVHSNDDLESHGFRRAGAYVRMHCDAVPVRKRGEPPLVEERDYAAVLAQAYAGLWGHKEVTRAAEPPEGAVVVGVPVTGLCTVWPDERLIDGPGVIESARSPEAYASLLLYACAVLGEGPADLDSWGDDDEVIEAYEDLGFDVVERVQGWELKL